MPRRAPLALLSLALLATPAPRLFAQAWSYPALQPPRTAVREFNFAVAQADGPGTSLVFQWREESGVRQQLSLDVGVADSDVENTDLMVFIGGQFAYQLSRSSDEVPMDFLLTAGAFLAVGEFTLFRFPVGLSVGHRFELEDGMALTPWLHPRVSIDLCNNCPDDSESDLALTFDLGMNFEVSRTISIRAAGIFTGNESFDNDGFGISVAWTPPGLTRSARRVLR